MMFFIQNLIVTALVSLFRCLDALANMRNMIFETSSEWKSLKQNFLHCTQVCGCVTNPPQKPNHSLKKSWVHRRALGKKSNKVAGPDLLRHSGGANLGPEALLQGAVDGGLRRVLRQDGIQGVDLGWWANPAPGIKYIEQASS